jgi:calcium-dependent protein kinase
VKKVKYKASGEIRAVKIIDKQYCIEKDSMISEIKVLKELDHPNILKLFEFYQDSQYYYLVTEYCAGRELFEKIVSLKHFSEMRAARIMYQVLSAIVYCHNHKICHRDLKPENLLLEDDNIDSNIKVIDFGTSKFCKLNERMKEKYGTPYYIAPEVIKKDYNIKCDVWSCGVILYIMLSGHPPFGGKTNDEIMNKVLEGSYNFARKEWTQVSEMAKDLIKKMLTYDPNDRISSAEAINHPWIKQYTKIFEPKEEILLSLSALNKFRLGQNLQVATLTFFASQMQSKSTEDKLRKQFKALDKNGDGMLSIEELILGFYEQCGDREKAEIEVAGIMCHLDINKDNTISYTEFLIAHMKAQDIMPHDRLRAAFDAFDLVHI